MTAALLTIDALDVRGPWAPGPSIRRSDYSAGVGAGEGQKIVVGDKITIQLDIQAMLESCP